MKIELEKLNRKSIKTLPRREWLSESTYNCLYLVPSGLKHDSGWMTVAIVGVKENGDMEVAAYPDDIEWNFSELNKEYLSFGVRMDCSWPNGIIHCHGRVRFVVGTATSSTEIKIVDIPKEKR